MQGTKRIVFLGLMISYSLVLHLIENILPGLHFIAPGAKLGLANIITLYLLYRTSKKDAFLVLVLRILLGSFFGGSLSALLYSLFGGIFSFVAMALTRKLERFQVGILGVSVVGALSFNIGQLIVAGLVIQNLSIAVYFPIMAYVSLGTGTFIGFVVRFLTDRSNYRESMGA